MDIMNKTIQFRIDEATKVEAEKIFDGLGLNMSSGIKVFLRTVVRNRSIPFEITRANGFVVPAGTRPEGYQDIHSRTRLRVLGASGFKKRSILDNEEDDAFT